MKALPKCIPNTDDDVFQMLADNDEPVTEPTTDEPTATAIEKKVTKKKATKTNVQVVKEHSKKHNELNKLENYLIDNYILRRNVVKNRMQTYNYTTEKWVDCSDETVNTMYILSVKNNIDVAEKLFYSLLYSSFVPSFDPIADMIANEPAYSTIEGDYIQSIADRVPVETETQALWRDWFKRWFVLYYGQALGYTANHQVIILIGGQGVGKSRFCLKLLPTGMENYFNKSNFHNIDKDSKIQLATNFLIEVDELEGLFKKDMAKVKQFISYGDINERVPYGKIESFLKRRASFIGSSNKAEILGDETGSRRFIPVQLIEGKTINLDGDFKINRAFKQAEYLVNNSKNGFGDFHFNQEVLKVLYTHNKNFKASDMIEDLLLTHYRPAEDGNSINVTVMQPFEILIALQKEVDGLQFQNMNAVSIGKALIANGFEKTQKYDSVKKYPVKAYKVQRITRPKGARDDYAF